MVEKKLYLIKINSPYTDYSFRVDIIPTRNIDLWHRRLGHLNKATVQKLLREGKLPEERADLRKVCHSCLEGKQTRSNFRGSLNEAEKAGEVIFTDLAGPFHQTKEGYRYFVTFIDSFSRYVVVRLLRNKSDTLVECTQFHKRFERQNNCLTKAVHNDNGGEYKPVEDYAEARSILHNHSIIHTRIKWSC